MAFAIGERERVSEKEDNNIMSSTGVKKHIHKYHKLSNGIWACALPDCTHYMPLNMPNGVLGKKTICWGCGMTFVLDDANMNEVNPTCLNCSNPSEVDLIATMLKEKGL